MLAKRVITTLMLNNGVLFRSKNFIPDHRFTLNFIDMWSVDEIIILDITRNLSFDDDLKSLFFKEILEISKNSYVPLTIGGGIRRIKDIEKLLNNGADKVIINTAALENPKIISLAAKEFGSQCIVVSIDVETKDNNLNLMENYGQIKSKFDLVEYIEMIQNYNAGEIFLQSVNMDGSLLGYDLNIIDKIQKHIKIPLIISCGAGNWSHVEQALKKDVVSAASLTNIFHFTEKSINNLKNNLKKSIYIRS
jgi:imidazole glycerol-phosphate synthase subunit HisF